MVKLYPKLARQNIRRGKQLYLPYLLTLVVTAAAFYISVALSRPEVWPGESLRYAYLSSFMSIGIFVIAVFAAVFLTYTGRFLAKGRQRELGLYNVLGMGKRHIALVQGFESLYLGVLGIAGGILLGTVLAGLMSRLLSGLMGLPAFGAKFSPAAAGTTAALFAAVLAFNLLLDLGRVRAQKPTQLLREENVGEREPKSRWLLAAVGFLALGAGYFIALTTKSALDALVVYFLAVLLVIVGTYCLFTAGSVALLKALRKNKTYYYQTPHFIGLSGMIHRMKRNGVGLANICILCTMVLVMVSGTLGLYIGVRQGVRDVFPQEAVMRVGYDPLSEPPIDREAMKGALAASLEGQGYRPKSGVEAEYFSATFRVLEDGAFLDAAARPETFYATAFFNFLDYESYEHLVGHGAVPRDGLAHVYTTGKLPDETALTLGVGPEGTPYTLALGERLTAAPKVTTALVYVTDFDYTVVMPRAQLLELFAARPAGEYTDWTMTWRCFWDLGGDPAGHQAALDSAMADVIRAAGETGYRTLGLESRASYAEDYYALNGGFLFLGVFLGTLFLLATLLILYYKQLSEGREDRSRFEIMRRVGLDERDVRRSVNSQMGLVFFAPLLVAGVHVAFDFPLISRLFTLFGLYDVGLELVCTVAVFAVFTALYAGMYRLTTRGYCKMVGQAA